MVRHGDRTSFSRRGRLRTRASDGAAWRPHPLESRRGRLRTRIYNLRTYDLLLFFSVADDLFVGMLVKGSFTVKYGRGVYILHYEEHIATYLKVHEIT